MLVVFTRFASAVIYFNLLLWHLLFKLAYSFHFVECHFFSLLWVVGLFWGDTRAFVFLLSTWHWLSRSRSQPDSESTWHLPLDLEFLQPFSVTVTFLNSTKKY